jgi:hypothetical protein
VSEADQAARVRGPRLPSEPLSVIEALEAPGSLSAYGVADLTGAALSGDPPGRGALVGNLSTRTGVTLPSHSPSEARCRLSLEAASIASSARSSPANADLRGRSVTAQAVPSPSLQASPSASEGFSSARWHFRFLRTSLDKQAS